MNKEQLFKSVELTKEYNDDLHKKLRIVNKIIKGQSKKKDKVDIEQIQEILILIGILLTGNIKIRYELEEFIKENRAFIDLSAIKSLSANCKLDIDALKATSFAMVEVLKSMKMQEDLRQYQENTM